MSKMKMAIIAAIIVVILILGSIFGDGYDFASDLYLIFIVGFGYAVYRLIKNRVSRSPQQVPALIREESYNKDQQQVDVQNLKNSAIQTGKKVGLGCLAFLIGFLIFSALSGVILGILLS